MGMPTWATCLESVSSAHTLPPHLGDLCGERLLGRRLGPEHDRGLLVHRLQGRELALERLDAQLGGVQALGQTLALLLQEMNGWMAGDGWIESGI